MISETIRRKVARTREVWQHWAAVLGSASGVPVITGPLSCLDGCRLPIQQAAGLCRGLVALHRLGIVLPRQERKPTREQDSSGRKVFGSQRNGKLQRHAGRAMRTLVPAPAPTVTLTGSIAVSALCDMYAAMSLTRPTRPERTHITQGKGTGRASGFFPPDGKRNPKGHGQVQIADAKQESSVWCMALKVDSKPRKWAPGFRSSADSDAISRKRSVAA